MASAGGTYGGGATAGISVGLQKLKSRITFGCDLHATRWYTVSKPEA